MRIALSAGHGGSDPGVVNGSLGLIEHQEAAKIQKVLFRRMVASGVDVVYIPPGVYTLSQKIREVNTAHAKKPIDLAMEIHFNSNSSQTAPGNGTEVLYLSMKNQLLASTISANIAAMLGTRDRGAKRRTDLGWLTQTKPPALIIEVLFLNNNAEAAKCKEPAFSDRVSLAIMSGLNGTI